MEVVSLRGFTVPAQDIFADLTSVFIETFIKAWLFIAHGEKTVPAQAISISSLSQNLTLISFLSNPPHFNDVAPLDANYLLIE